MVRRRESDKAVHVPLVVPVTRLNLISDVRDYREQLPVPLIGFELMLGHVGDESLDKQLATRLFSDTAIIPRTPGTLPHSSRRLLPFGPCAIRPP